MGHSIALSRLENQVLSTPLPDVNTLQRLRMKLGLNRPKEEYEELLLTLTNDDNNNNDRMKRGAPVKVKGLVNASKHNGKSGIVTKVLPSAEGEVEEGGRRRVGVKLSDDSGTVLNIKIENLELSSSTTATMSNRPNPSRNSNRPDPFEYLVGRKDGTVHIGSTPNDV